jgi:hypothetical protein
VVYVQPEADAPMLMMGKVIVLAEMWVELEETLMRMKPL